MRINTRTTAALACLTIIFALGIAGCAHHTPPVASRSWQAGLAEIDITPPVGYRMAGYFYERFSTSIHDPLKAKAIVLRQGNCQAALVFCDLVGPSLNVTRKARAEASRATGIPFTNIVIAATHSHTGPLFDDVRGDYFHHEAVAKYGYDAHATIDYPAFLTSQLVRVIENAKANLQPVDLDAGIASQTGVSFNRRYYMKDGSVKFNPGLLNPNIVGPAGPVDPDVGILLVEDAMSKPVGGLTVFAMHCDTVGGTEFSADYPYYIQQTLRQAFGPRYISAFGAGTSGNINHVDVSKKGPVSGFDVTQRLGDTIGKTVLDAVPDLQPIDHPSLAVQDKVLMLPLQTVDPRQVAAAKVMMSRLEDPKMDFYLKVRVVKIMDLARRGTNYPAEIQVFRLDRDTAIVCLPAEIFVEFGLAIKKASPFKRTMVISICNDRPSYVPTLKAFQQGSYEVINSRLAPGSGEKMVEAAIKMLNDLKRDL